MKYIAIKLTVYINADETNWAEISPHLISAYNTSKHSTTQLKSNYLLFGVEPNLTIDTILEKLDTSESTAEKTIGEYITEFRIKWKNALDFANILTTNMHDKNAQNYDKNKFETTYQRGDLVYVRNNSREVGSTQKLHNKYESPYEIIQIVQNGLNLTLKPTGKNTRKKQLTNVHVSKLRRHKQ